MYQGSLIYGVSHYRIALNSRAWQGGTTGLWKSLLADPNCFDQGCPPTLTSNVLLGQISTNNGASYTQVFGNVVSMAYVDSVQNMGLYDTLGHMTAWKWNWPNVTPAGQTPEPPYDDTLTIGFHSCTKVVGVTGVAELADFYVVRNAITSRNHVTIPNLYMSEVQDYDIGPTAKRDVAAYDAAHSMGFMYDCGSPVNAWGLVKIPFGCGYAPLLGTITLASGQPLYPDTNPFLDSAYIWMQRTGANFQLGTSGCSADPDDRAMWTNFQVSTIPPNDTVVYAYARFEKTMANANDPANYYELANTINKWCGFGRGDVNNDGKVDLVDIAFLINYVTGTGQPGPYPFLHLGDVNGDGAVNPADVTYLKDFYFSFGPCPVGKWTF
jgi:hypothetical protein